MKLIRDFYKTSYLLKIPVVNYISRQDVNIVLSPGNNNYTIITMLVLLAIF